MLVPLLFPASAEAWQDRGLPLEDPLHLLPGIKEGCPPGQASPFGVGNNLWFSRKFQQQLSAPKNNGLTEMHANPPPLSILRNMTTVASQPTEKVSLTTGCEVPHYIERLVPVR